MTGERLVHIVEIVDRRVCGIALPLGRKPCQPTLDIFTDRACCFADVFPYETTSSEAFPIADKVVLDDFQRVDFNGVVEYLVYPPRGTDQVAENVVELHRIAEFLRLSRR